jgi:ADP-ribosylglycohydrolase
VKPDDHDERIARARVALDGLSIGDAFGERFFVSPQTVMSLIDARAIPRAPWGYTDDTEMALGIFEVLERLGRVDQDELARVFARRYRERPDRGYGGGAHAILRVIGDGMGWKHVRTLVFGGGSMGNGGAMRVAPIGAYFADDDDRVSAEARASAEITHAHPDGQAGAIAVASACAWAFRHRGEERAPKALLEHALARTPDGETRTGIAKAIALDESASTVHAASVLGTGARVVSSDTVPFALWCAARHLDDYVEAMWTTVSGLGDRDTTCAIVGGIVALASPDTVPGDWRDAREPLA